MSNAKLTLGLIVNPYAGIGGQTALKGSDGALIRQQALALNATLHAPKRVQVFIDQLGTCLEQIQWVTASGKMGADYLANQNPLVVYQASEPSESMDTQQAVNAICQASIDLLIFVGGDGTARDIVDVIDSDCPVLGLPSGVKMQSGVFALSPQVAAELVKGLLAVDLVRSTPQDVRDIDEEALRENKIQSRWYGTLQVPAAPEYLQHLKSGGVESDDLVIDEIADEIAEIIEDNPLVIIGPGRTTHYFMQKYGFKNTLVGFDAIKDGKLFQNDLKASDLLLLKADYPSLKIIISPTGNQGFLIGRGNQQLTPEFLSGLKKSQWCIVAPRSKLQAYNKRPLLLDTNSLVLDKAMSGLYPVMTGYKDYVYYPVNATYESSNDKH
ncbi:MAG: ATP-NAD kinase family protein [Cellvibrionales bacterium]|nr:ATP-NAD kinase family protein [Cellvibrionales bacterium]